MATVLIGIASFWMVHDFPDQAKFLSDKERALVYQRLSDDKQASAEHENFVWKHLWASLRDWKTYTSSLIYMGCGAGLYAFSLFLPTSTCLLLHIALTDRSQSSSSSVTKPYMLSSSASPHFSPLLSSPSLLDSSATEPSNAVFAQCSPRRWR